MVLMTPNMILQIILFLVVLIAFVKPLGGYMARVYEGTSPGADRAFGWLERLIYRAGGIDPTVNMTWKQYTTAALVFNFLGISFVYLLQRVQHVLPLNPQGMPAISADSAFNTAVSFATNTNWQAYSGEAAMSYMTQMLGLAVQNFLSAATAMAVLVALIRGFARRESSTIGNFWVDLTRSILHILLPLSLILAVVLVSQGVVQNFQPYRTVELIDPAVDATGSVVSKQVVPMGPAASQVAIKQLGTNGGGFFNANSAHPLENPTPLSNFLEVLAILVIPASLCYTFGRMVGDVRQGWALLAAMLVIFIPLLLVCAGSEQGGNPAIAKLGVDQSAGAFQSGGNMEGKEVRFGVSGSTIWATATTAASNGSVNAMHDSFTPLGGLVPLWLMQLGEVVFGGAGSGLYGMIVFAVIAVFIAGLMVGRTPEYLGVRDEDGGDRRLDSAHGGAGRHGDRGARAGGEFGRGGRHDEKSAQQPGRPRVLGNPVRVLIVREQQRQRFRRSERQRRVLQPRARRGDVRAPVLADRPDAGPRGLAGEEAGDPHVGRNAADSHAAVRRAARRRCGHPRRADVHPGAGARAGRRTLADDQRTLTRW
jgi:potassium-transporting ATPase potassium-binding subunit